MTKLKTTQYRLLPEWNITQVGDVLRVYGGADASYEIELEHDYECFFATVASRKPFKRTALLAPDQRILEQLLTAEVVVPVLAQHLKNLRVRVIDPHAALKLASNDVFELVDNASVCDVAVVVRAKHSYADFLSEIEYQDIAVPHVFIDMAFHHTISVGPLVFVGETACVACLQGRLSTRWGDAVPPPQPKTALDYNGLAQAIVAVELQKIAQKDTSLVGKTFAWNVQDRTVSKNQLLKVPLCPICNQNKIDQTGALALPWSQHESPRHPV